MSTCLVYGRRRGTRERLADVLSRGRVPGLPPFEDPETVTTPTEAHAALAAVARELVVVGVEDGDPSRTWLDVLRHARQADPPVPTVVVGPVALDGADPDAQPAVLALAHGARGYLRACDLARGDDPVPPVLTPARPPSADLSPRETDVLLGMTEGLSNAEIAASLVLAEDTVKTHARRLFRKLGAGDRADAVARGFRQGLIR